MAAEDLENNSSTTSLINLELVNKNDKKLIKLNSNRSILLANYDITNSIVDSFKTKISKIIGQETLSPPPPPPTSSQQSIEANDLKNRSEDTCKGYRAFT